MVVRVNLRLHLLVPLCLTCTTLVWLAATAIQQAQVQIVVEGGLVHFEPATFRLRIRVEPHQDNRGLTAAAIVDGLVIRSSYEQLDGSSPRTRWVQWPDMPAGDYTVLAHLARTQQTLTDRAAVTVIGR